METFSNRQFVLSECHFCVYYTFPGLVLQRLCRAAHEILIEI